MRRHSTEDTALVAIETVVVGADDIEEEDPKPELALEATEEDDAPEEVATRLDDAREADAVLALVGTAEDEGSSEDVALVRLVPTPVLLVTVVG